MLDADNLVNYLGLDKPFLIVYKESMKYLSDLQKALKEAGLPYSKSTIIYKYEAPGIIPSPRNKLNNWRTYTEEQITEYVEKVREAIC